MSDRPNCPPASPTLLAGIVHELRNPLFGLGATLDALEQRLGSRESVGQHLEVMRKELERLVALARELAELTRGRGAPVALEMHELLKVEVARRAVRARERGVELLLRVPSAAGALSADRERLELAVGRLLEFAVARTPPGGAVRVHAHGRDEGSNRRIIVVLEDGGPPLAPEALAEVLEPFGVRKDGRLSLDLAIAASIAQAHGGSLAVTPMAGEGLRYALELPAAQPAAPTGEET